MRVNIDIIDFNSSYPDAMLNDMPVGEATYVKTLEDIDYGFARVKFKTPANLKIPVLPVKTEDGIIYAVGEGEGVRVDEIIFVDILDSKFPEYSICPSTSNFPNNIEYLNEFIKIVQGVIT